MNEHEKEFLPAVLEVTEMPPSHAARLLTYVIVAMFTVLILWSVIGKIDIIATAAGKLMPASNIKTIQTLTDSEIEEIYVQEGEYVKAGQDLIKFNQTEVIANISRSGKQKSRPLRLQLPASGFADRKSAEKFQLRPRHRRLPYKNARRFAQKPDNRKIGTD